MGAGLAHEAVSEVGEGFALPRVIHILSLIATPDTFLEFPIWNLKLEVANCDLIKTGI